MKEINTNELQEKAMPAGQSAASCSVDRLKVLDLFSGIGGFSLGLERAGMETVAFCEIEEFPRKVLNKHWPDVPIFEDVRKLHAEDLPEAVDVVCGGFPCQPISLAGKQKGEGDDRYLWPEMFRIIKECDPTWVIGENVAGLDGLGLQQSISDLESIGYEVAPPLEIPACGVGHDHLRARLWILAYSNNSRLQTGRRSRGVDGTEMDCWRLLQKHLHPTSEPVGCFGRKEITTESRIPRVNDGVPDRVDRNKAIGNAVVPEIPEMIGRAILAQTA